jgi:hypothetical protein
MAPVIMLRRRPRQPSPASAVEIQFVTTPDGLVVDRVILKPARPDDEVELRWFLERYRDPALDLTSFVREGSA